MGLEPQMHRGGYAAINAFNLVAFSAPVVTKSPKLISSVLMSFLRKKWGGIFSTPRGLLQESSDLVERCDDLL